MVRAGASAVTSYDRLLFNCREFKGVPNGKRDTPSRTKHVLWPFTIPTTTSTTNIVNFSNVTVILIKRLNPGNFEIEEIIAGKPSPEHTLGSGGKTVDHNSGEVHAWVLMIWLFTHTVPFYLTNYAACFTFESKCCYSLDWRLRWLLRNHVI